MIRNIVLLDGTWNTPRDVTNICKLSPDDSPFGAFIPRSAGGVSVNGTRSISAPSRGSASRRCASARRGS